jgi:CRISPR/Cas system-associated exonuclease Cas4 (RecB family)
MKNLESVPTWVGKSVHEVAECIMKSFWGGDIVSENEAILKLTRDMKAGWEISASRRYRNRPNKLLGLQEHYYGEVVSEDTLLEAIAIAKTCIINLYTQPIYMNLIGDNSIKIIEIEELGDTLISGIKTWVKVDMALIDGDRVKIIDWKTGMNTDGDRIDLQLTIYAIYGSQKWGVSPENIIIGRANLRSGDYKEMQMTEEMMKHVLEYIKSSANHMRILLSDPDENTAQISDFPMNLNMTHCRFCNFKRACGREILI